MILKHTDFTLQKADGNVLTFTSVHTGTVVRVFVLEDDIIRVLFSDGALRPDKTWMVAPRMEDIPREGRDRLDISPFSCPKFSTSEKDGVFTLETAKIKVDFVLDGMKASWYYKSPEGCVLLARDRQTQAYNFNHSLGEGVYHYLERS